MADYGLALQTAIFNALSAALSVTVYDDVPANAQMPYVVIDNQFAQDASPLVEVRSEFFVYLTVWSKQAGQHQVLAVMADIFDALDRQKPTLTAGRVVDMRVIRRESGRDADDKTYMGMVTVRAIVEHT